MTDSTPATAACCFTTVPGREHNINCPRATAAPLITVNHDDLDATVNLVERLRQHLTTREWSRLPTNEVEAFDRIRGVTDADYR